MTKRQGVVCLIQVSDMKKAKPPVKISNEDAVYAIGIVSKLLGLPEWTLRAFEKEGLVQPKRLNRKIRVYSLKDIRRIEYIHYLMEVKGVNMRGVKFIMRIET